MTIAEALVKPFITGLLIKFVKLPRRNREKSSKKNPVSNDKFTAYSIACSGVSGVKFVNVLAIISEIIAAGPTTKVLLEPKTAYTTNGKSEQYRPYSAGSPAKFAYAMHCGTAMKAVTNPATKSEVNFSKL